MKGPDTFKELPAGWLDPVPIFLDDFHLFYRQGDQEGSSIFCPFLRESHISSSNVSFSGETSRGEASRVPRYPWYNRRSLPLFLSAACCEWQAYQG